MTKDEVKANIQSELESTDNFPPELPMVKNSIGKSDLMYPRTFSSCHDATPLLMDYATNGCPVDCGPDWSLDKIKLLLKKGPHKSSNKKDAVRQLRNETAEKVEMGYARVVSWKDIKNNIPKKLKISPVAMIPHKSKKYRCILDLSFTLYHEGNEYVSVNETTNKMAKPEAMAQLGLCLQRVIATMADNFDLSKPFIFSKLDIKDGFWRMRVSNENAWNFCYVLPTLKTLTSDDDIEIVVPNSLQMGWCESPPFFCSGSETARDIIDHITTYPNLPSHRFENIMLKEVLEQETLAAKGESTLFEVFVDDFVGVTNNTTTTHLTHISRAMINGIHSIFPPPEVTTHSGGDPISKKKLDKGEGVWSHCKEILGWDLDGKNFTIQLPPAKCDAIVLQIRKMLKLTRTSLNKYQKITGKLQHASFGIPCGRALFSPLQMAMRNNPKFINLTEDLRQIFLDWTFMIRFMKNHPTSVLQLVTNYPDYVGHSDACGLGCGGTWTSGLKPIEPILWQYEWPDDIKHALISDHNPNGSLTINDLELAGLVLNWLALECQTNIHLAFHHIGAFCDNTSAVSWTHKLRTSKSRVAGRLLRMLGLRIHARQASSLLPVHIAGSDNTMADIVSRAFKSGKFFMANSNLVSYFNKNFPFDKNNSWTEFQIPIALISRVTSCLRDEQLHMELLLKLPGIARSTGVTGATMLRCSSAIPSSLTCAQSTAQTLSQDLPQTSARVYTVEELKSEFRPSRMRSRPLTRPSSWPANKLPYTGHHKSTRSRLND
jgi:hypothetical protein